MALKSKRGPSSAQSARLGRDDNEMLKRNLKNQNPKTKTQNKTKSKSAQLKLAATRGLTRVSYFVIRRHRNFYYLSFYCVYFLS